MKETIQDTTQPTWTWKFSSTYPEGRWYNGENKCDKTPTFSSGDTILITVDHEVYSKNKKDRTNHLHVAALCLRTKDTKIENPWHDIKERTDKKGKKHFTKNGYVTLLWGITYGGSGSENEHAQKCRQGIFKNATPTWSRFVYNERMYQRIHAWQFEYCPGTTTTPSYVAFAIDYGDPQLRTSSAIAVSARSTQTYCG